MEVRQLAVKDAMALARMASRMKLRKAADNETVMEYGQAIISMVMDTCGDEALAWLGSMVGMSREEFSEQPAVAIVDVIQAIAAQDGARDFFSRVWGLIPKSSNFDWAGQTTSSGASASGAT
jgi:hypothetical protein